MTTGREGLDYYGLAKARVVPGTENTPQQRRRALVFTLQQASGAEDLRELVGMLGLGDELDAVRSAS